MKVPDLFNTRPPFNPHNYAVERNLYLIADGSPDSESILAHTQRIINHETTYDMNKTKFDSEILLNRFKEIKT